MKRAAFAVVALAALCITALAGVSMSGAVFNFASTNPQGASSVPDFVAPTASAAVIQRAGGGGGGGLRPSDGYFVYANVTDTGNPASGVSTVTANVSNITAGQTAVPLTACVTDCTVGATTYAYKSAQQTADTQPPLTDGAKTYNLTMTDNATNQGTSSNFSVTIDGTAPVIGTSMIRKTAGGSGGAIGQGVSYQVFANATDTGGSGVDTVTADVSNITTGATAVTLTACTTDCAGFAFKSSVQAADNPLTEGSKSYSLFATDKAGNSSTPDGRSVTVENTAPTVSQVAVQKTAGGTDGFVGPAGYVVYADAADNLGGSGLDLLTADVSQLGGSTAAPLSACSVSCTVAGHAYAFKSGTLTVAGGVTDGSKTITVTATDVAGNTGSLGNSPTADSTAPATTDIQTANGGTTAGKIDTGDTITYSFSETMEPNSILAGWDGSAQAVKVKVTDGSGNPATRNRLTITTTADAAVALGTVNLTQEYAPTNAVLTGSMSRVGSTIVVTIGALSSGTLATVATTGTMAWTPSALATDLAGNALPTTVRNETTPPADVEF